MLTNSLRTAQTVYAVITALVHTRLEPVRQRSDRGASAIEWAIIAAVSVGLAIGVGALIITKVHNQSNCINSGGDGCTGN